LNTLFTIRQIKHWLPLRVIWNKHFKFPIPSRTNIIMFEIMRGDLVVGWLASEDYGKVVGIHLYLIPERKTLSVVKALKPLLKDSLVPALKELGKEFIVTNCDQADASTTHLLMAVGFRIKPVVVAEMQI